MDKLHFDRLRKQEHYSDTTYFMTGESSPSRKSTQKLTASIRLTSCASVAGTERGAYLLYTDQSRPRNQGLNPHRSASSYIVILGIIMEHYPESHHSHEIRVRSYRRSDWKSITHLQLDHLEEVSLGAWHGKELFLGDELGEHRLQQRLQLLEVRGQSGKLGEGV